LLQSLNVGLRSAGFAAAGESAIGVVGIPRWFTPGARIPESISVWGHTAVYVRTGGQIQIVRGFMPASLPQTILHAGSIEAGLSGTPAAISSDVGLFTKTGAMSIEYPVAPEVAEAFAKGLPPPGPVGPGEPPLYTARPAVRCLGPNCVLWAVEKAESVLEGPIGPKAPGISVTAMGGKGTASQGRLIGFMEEAAKAPGEVAAVERATGSAVASGMPKSLQVLKWGGRLFLVAGAVMVPVEVAMAPKGERVRTAVGATSGFAGGFAAGAGAGLVCGPGALACSIILGIGFGLAGYFAARGIAEEIYDEASGRKPRAAVPARSKEDLPLSIGCFTGDTLVSMADGTSRAIADIREDDEVLSFNKQSGKICKEKVVNIHAFPSKPYIKLAVSNGVPPLKVTHEHPVFSNGTWVPVGRLKIGAELTRLNSAKSNVEKVELIGIESPPNSSPVFNLSVTGCHTFFAGGILVHNKFI